MNALLLDSTHDPGDPTNVRDEPADGFAEEDGWHVISRYTRAAALADGTLVDVSAMGREAGIRYPVAMTRAVWNTYVALTRAAKRAGCDERGRCWDIVWMLRYGILRHARDSEFL